ncbi:hypothetical protein AB0M46_39680 [Dactylosporangium sp. NPDC051485]|uniref:hypothetical protein n=1 Tax=Dactylosporangium sp. NPDC051485 TaxID=3154846 RepID=UPI00343E40AE
MTMHLTDPLGYAVRLDWPSADHAASHEFTQFTTSLDRALRRAASTRRFWSRGPLRPLAVTVVLIGRGAYRAHARDCTSRRCPTTAPLLGLGADAGTSLLR